VDVTLNPAPPEPEPPAPVAAPVTPAAIVGPTGAPLTLSVVDLLEKEFVGTQPRRESLLSCSGNTRTTIIQLNMPMPDRLYDTADATYYVIGGEGAVRIAGRETKLATNAFVSVPRGTPHAFTRGGRRPLILLAVLSGEPCEQAR
jgi:Cupin domain